MTTTPGALSALVVGGASGIGEATARKLASRGITVCIADCNVDQAKIVAAAVVRDFDVRAEVVYVDVGEEESIRAAVDHAAHMTGRLDFAANCAGICESVWDEEISISSEVFDRTHTINTRGIWLCQKYEAAQMQKQVPRAICFTPASKSNIPGQRGAIANVASISGLHAMGLAAYTPSKYAAIAVTKNGAKFYGPQGIRCNALCPGWTMTAMIEHSMGEEGTAGTEANIRKGEELGIAIGRMAVPEEQANVLGWLLSDDSTYVNGSVIVCDGGYHDIR